MRYVVSLKVAKGDRSATASRSFTPGSAQQALSAELRRSCGVDLLTGTHLPCPPLHNPTDPLTLIALPDFDAPFDMDVSAEGRVHGAEAGFVGRTGFRVLLMRRV